jgi:hypothetical protein
VCVFLACFARETAGAARIRHFLLPLLSRDDDTQTSGASRREMPTCVCCLKFESNFRRAAPLAAIRRGGNWRMADDMANDNSLVTSITLNVIAGHSSLPYADYVNLSALPASNRFKNVFNEDRIVIPGLVLRTIPE